MIYINNIRPKVGRLDAILKIKKSDMNMTLTRAKDIYDLLSDGNKWKGWMNIRDLPIDFHLLEKLFDFDEECNDENEGVVHIYPPKYYMVQNSEEHDKAYGWYNSLSDIEKGYVDFIVNDKQIKGPIG